MGVKIVAEVIHDGPCSDGPDGLIDAEFKLLMVLAEDARDATRECWPGMAELVARTHKAASTVRRLLTSLERKKLIKRLPARRIQPGAHEVVAHRGRRTVYRIEPMPGLSDTQALTCEHLSHSKDAHARAERRSILASKGLTGEHPSPQVPADPVSDGPVEITSSVVAACRAALLERSGRDVGDEWARMVAVNLLGGRRGVTSPQRWIRTVIGRETDLQRFLPVPRA